MKLFYNYYSYLYNDSRFNLLTRTVCMLAFVLFHMDDACAAGARGEGPCPLLCDEAGHGGRKARRGRASRRRSSTSRSAVDDGRLRTAQRVHRSGLDAGPETVAGVGVAVCGHLRVLRVPLHALCSGNLAYIAPATAKHTRERARTRADECMRADQCTRGACAVMSSAWQSTREDD